MTGRLIGTEIIWKDCAGMSTELVYIYKEINKEVIIVVTFLCTCWCFYSSTTVIRLFLHIYPLLGKYLHCHLKLGLNTSLEFCKSSPTGTSLSVTPLWRILVYTNLYINLYINSLNHAGLNELLLWSIFPSSPVLFFFFFWLRTSNKLILLT